MLCITITKEWGRSAPSAAVGHSLLLFVMFCTFCSSFFCTLFQVKSLRCINDRAQTGGWSSTPGLRCVLISGTCWENLRDWKATTDGYKFLCEHRKGRRRGEVTFYVREKSKCMEVSCDHKRSIKCFWIKAGGVITEGDLGFGVCLVSDPLIRMARLMKPFFG